MEFEPMSNPLYGHPEAARLRKNAGVYLKELRAVAGLTQRELALELGLTYYTLIAQFEAGKGRLPPDKMAAAARAFKVKRHVFAQRLTQFYDPHLWEMLWGPETVKEGI